AGATAGKGIAESVDPTVEDAYWRENYANRSYYDQTHTYDGDYAPAYRYGWESRSCNHDRTWDQAESDLKQGWESAKANSRLTWEKAKHATRDAWDRVTSSITGKRSSSDAARRTR